MGILQSYCWGGRHVVAGWLLLFLFETAILLLLFSMLL